MNAKKHSVSNGARFFLRELTIEFLLTKLRKDDPQDWDDEDSISVNLNWNGMINNNLN